MRILVVTGTHEQPFQRLLDEVRVLASAAAGDEEWVVQFGVGSWSPVAGVEASAYLPHAEMQARYRWADVVVSQASPGIVFAADAAGAWPLVVGRRKAYGEHVDDHQVEFAEVARREGWASSCAQTSELGDALAELRREGAQALEARATEAWSRSQEHAAGFRSEVWSQIFSLVGVGAGVGVR